MRKIILLIEKNFWDWRLKGENFPKKIKITRTIYLNSEILVQLMKQMFFNLFLEVFSDPKSLYRRCKDLTNRLLFLLIISFWEHIHLARMWRLKNGWPLSVPPRAYFYHPQLPKKLFGESWNQTAFTKKIWEFVIKIEGIHTISALDGQNLGRICPPPPGFRVKGHDRKVIDKTVPKTGSSEGCNCQECNLPCFAVGAQKYPVGTAKLRWLVIHQQVLKKK